MTSAPKKAKKKAAKNSLVSLASPQTPAAQAVVVKNALAKLSAEYMVKSSQVWKAAAKEASAHVLLVLKNNPKTPIEQVLARPDVQQALSVPFLEAAQKTEAVITEAIDKAAALGHVSAQKDLDALGIPTTGDLEVDISILQTAMKTVNANAASAGQRIQQALLEASQEKGKGYADAFKRIARDLDRRAQYSTEWAVWQAAMNAREHQFDVNGTNKMWVARMDDKTCLNCQALHGTVLAPWQEFPKTFPGVPELGTYGDFFYGPPRHPNCRCILVPVP